MSAIFIMIALAGYLFFADYQKKQEATLQLKEDHNNYLSIKLHQRDSLINDYMSTFNQIEKDLQYIKEQEKILDVQSNDPEFSGDKRKQIVHDIKLVNTLIEKNKDKIAELNEKLKKSGLKINGMNEKLAMLSQTIEERDKAIEILTAELTQKDEQITQLNTQIVQIEDSVKFQKKIINHQINQLNKAYIAYGNQKELKERKIISKDGGFLGLGKTTTLNEDVSNEYFTEVDITKTQSFPVFSTDAELITEHPADSYEWVTENDTITYMIVNNPEEFWKISKYAVVETK
jgi:chromosome segregation ATPase